MEIDNLVNRPCEWLRGDGTENDIVFSSRLRLARNLADFPFCNRASISERKEIREALMKTVDSINQISTTHTFDMEQMPEIDRLLLMERQLISKELANNEGPRNAIVSENEDVSLMINEEDHLRIQGFHRGYDIRKCWEVVDRIDDLIEENVCYAFSDEFGYLTACPTNVGTGIRVSVMMHLPALAMTKQLDKVFRALQKIQLTVRGLYGEGSQASGDLYQISNNITLGKTESEIIANLEEVVPRIIQYERKARENLLEDNLDTIHDKISRSLGTLCSAKTISSDETLHLLSSVRLGINLKLIDHINIDQINELFLLIQPAHLQKMQHKEMSSTERNVARASFLRSRLIHAEDNPN